MFNNQSILFLLCAAAIAVFAQTEPLTPVEMGLEPPPVPEAEPVFSGDAVATNFSFVKLPAQQEWVLTFEHCPTPDFSTNVTVYPITIQVPFEAEGGFVRIKARKVEVQSE